MKYRRDLMVMSMDNLKVLGELGYPETDWNIAAVEEGKNIVSLIEVCDEDQFFRFPAAFGVAPVRVTITKQGPVCTCGAWRYRHRGWAFADPDWICPHGAAVLMLSGLSQTYWDWCLERESKARLPQNGSSGVAAQFLPVAVRTIALFGQGGSPQRTIALFGQGGSPQRTIALHRSGGSPQKSEPEQKAVIGYSMRKFYAAFSKKHRLKWRRYGLDVDMVKEAIYAVEGVLTLNDLSDALMEKYAAQVQGAISLEALMENFSEWVKLTLETREYREGLNDV